MFKERQSKITFEVIILTNHQPHIIISLKTTLVQLTYIFTLRWNDCHGTFIVGNQKLMELARDKPFELCLTSNIINKTRKSYETHHFGDLFKANHQLCICTDDKGLFGASLSDEYEHVQRAFNLDIKTMFDISKKSIDQRAVKFFIYQSRKFDYKNMSKKVTLLQCGSFNPPHYMHLRSQELAKIHLEKLQRTVIAGWMSPVSDGYKKTGLVCSKHRIEMLKCATADSSWIRVSSWEADKPEWTPTAEVVKYHVEKSKEEFDAQTYLLLGGDAFASFNIQNLWTDSDVEMIASNGIIVVDRDGSNVQQIIEENEILTRYRNNIEVVSPGIVNGLSSTYVRQLLMEKQSIKYLVPEELRKYLEDNEIYTAESQNTNKDTVLAPLKLYTTK
ncbi:unnamed protein product [Oikopleura dioica]|uniref:Nicotinamide-nucleotide adenylyltransferase n=1 Tax=Oikopleura dioica TaxID=34765 RepID=E4X458_OIKDI|nr:unnamed protein product [Oikopleura dioica]